MADGGENPDCPAPGIEPYGPRMRAVGLALFIFVVLYIPATLLWWWKRRSHYMLRKRSFWLMAFSSLGVFFNVFTAGWVNFNGPYSLPCDVHAWTVFLVLPLGAGPVVARLVLFYHKHRFTQLLLEENRAIRDMQQHGTSSVFQKLSFWQELRAVARWLVGINRRRRQRRRRQRQRNPGSKGPLSTSVTDAAESASTISADIDRGSLPEISSDFSALRAMSQRNWYSITVFLIFFLLGAVLVILQYLPEDSPYGKGCFGCRLALKDFFGMGSILLIITVTCCTVLWRLRGVPDPLRIKFELQLSCVVGLFIVLGTGLGAVDPLHLRRDRVFDWLYLVNLGCLAYHTVQCPLAILRTYERNNIDTEVTFESVLENHDTRAAFTRYLATEFSVENMYFYEDVERYKSKYSILGPDRSMIRVEEIISKYIEEGAILEINISESIRREILRRFRAARAVNDSPPLELFDAAQDNLFLLMKSDSFPRFRRSELYRATQV